MKHSSNFSFMPFAKGMSWQRWPGLQPQLLKCNSRVLALQKKSSRNMNLIRQFLLSNLHKENFPKSSSTELLLQHNPITLVRNWSHQFRLCMQVLIGLWKRKGNRKERKRRWNDRRKWTNQWKLAKPNSELLWNLEILVLWNHSVFLSYLVVAL